jgi:hypothetical protein
MMTTLKIRGGILEQAIPSQFPSHSQGVNIYNPSQKMFMNRGTSSKYTKNFLLVLYRNEEEEE